jgi:hypothetical protein
MMRHRRLPGSDRRRVFFKSGPADWLTIASPATNVAKLAHRARAVSVAAR